MSTLTLVAVGVIVVFIAYAVYASIQAGRKRTTELQALAPRLGLSFVGAFVPTSGAAATGNPQNAFDALRAELGDFRRFQGSMQPRLSNWMRGDKDGAQVAVFDYFDGGDVQRNTPNTQTLAWVEAPSLNLPSFWLRPIPGRYVVPIARFTQAAAGLVGTSRHADQDVDMSRHTEFENQYLLRGADEGALRRLFTDRVVQFFQANPGWTIEGDGKRLLLNRLNPDEVRTYWRGAVPPSDVKEIAAAASALKEGTLGEKLTALPGVPPSEWPSFLDAVMRVTAVLRTS